MTGTEQRGFTLIEMLVVVTLLGLLAIGLAQGTRLGLKAWDAQSRIVAEHDELDATDRALRLLISHLLTPPAESEIAQTTGSASRLTIITTMPASMIAATKVVDASLGLDAQHRLMLRWRLHFHEQRFGNPPEWSEVELLSGVERVVFSYRPVGSGTQWQNDWSDPAPPALIKVHLDFAAGDPRSWPDIVVAPVLAQTDG